MRGTCFVIGLLLSTPAWGQVAIPAQSVPQDLAVVKGKVDRFTLSAEGLPDGFILEDGTEVHVHVYLARKLVAAVRRGEPVTVRGLRAPAMPFFSASSVTSDLDHKVVADTGSLEAGEVPGATGQPAAHEVTLEGTIVRPIHRSDGAVIGAFLSSGVEVRMPDGVAADWPNLFKPGQNLAVAGQDVQTEFGRVIRIAMLGPSTSQLSPVTPGFQPPPRP
jgi:hypothetical protein